MVADKIEVLTKKPLSDEAFSWKSDANDYTIEKAEKADFGTQITLYLKDDEFLDSYRLENIIKKYSNHIPYPIFLQKEKYVASQKEGEEGHYESEISQVNKANALWRLPKSNLKEQDYFDFYKQISHDSSDPLLYIHTKAEGVHEYTTLFFVPSVQPFDLFRVDYQSGVKLYVKRVFITDDAKELLPPYLRFVRGIIDIEDLPLNVSREILQENRIMQTVKAASVKKILGELEKIKNSDKEKYAKFYKLFGKVLKEGLWGFSTEKDEILKLCLFKSSKTGELIDLAEYKKSMAAEQKEIYYISGGKAETLKNSPLLEEFNAKNIEVLICDDEIDTIIMPMIGEFDKTPIKSVMDADFSDDKGEISAQDLEIAEKIKENLKDKVKDVKISKRLKNALGVLVFDKNDPNYAMQAIYKQMGQENLPEVLPILEINKDHEIIKKLTANQSEIAKISNIIFDLAKLSEGQNIDDASEFAKNVSEIIAKAI